MNYDKGYGKIFATMYTGSMVGSGAIMFALWPYVIANMLPEYGENGKIIGGRVELNPKLLSAIFGELEEDIEGAIKKCCDADAESRSEDEDGRKLIKRGQYEYDVVNFVKYNQIRQKEKRKESNRKAQAAFRARKGQNKNGPRYDGAARRFEQSIINGEPTEVQDKIVEETLPQPKEPPEDIPF